MVSWGIKKKKLEILNRRLIKDYSPWITETQRQMRGKINEGTINRGSTVHSGQN
jgi:hypothetical protein